ncbi:MAG: prephenate dehydrogenase [Candidatus Nanopelagicaceae bacterium]
MITSVRIVGAGLIGTSIGLALRSHGVHVDISDSDKSAEALAKDLARAEKLDNPEVIIVAVPVSKILDVLRTESALYPRSILMDVGSTKYELQVKVDGLSDLRSQFVGTHPMAGREVSGPTAARNDLFAGRAWPIVKSTYTSSAALEKVKEVIGLCGATTYEMGAEEHDRAVSVLSHLPQILSSAMAGQLHGLSNDELVLSGQGLRDLTRLAASDKTMWIDILRSNRQFIIHALNSLGETLDTVLSALIEDDEKTLEKLLVVGKDQQQRISGKHGAQPRDYSFINVVVGDKPGQLGALFIECANVSVNVEDITLEHSPGQQTGLITLALSAKDADVLYHHLVKLNWQVHRA